ncbi:MAG: TolC family protein [Cyclobacteriaceae bacterium]|nr:TolC family protein [Cyclobacteriaceae bacterium]
MNRFGFIVLSIAICGQAFSQSLPDLLKLAEQNYPLLKAKGYEVLAGNDLVSLAKSAAVPTLDAAYQLNYATFNNITGMATAQGFVPISGPPSEDNVYQGVYGTAGGLLMNWDVLTFGQRKSKIESAKAQQAYREADEKQEIFHHQIKTANAWLDVVMAEELIKVYTKNLERAEENVRIVKSLVRSGLRPGVDTALFKAEASRAKIDLLNYQNLKEQQVQLLSELVGGVESSFASDTSFFNRLPNVSNENVLQNHPLISLSTSRVLVQQFERTQLQRTLNPKLSFWGTTYARGSGIRHDGFVNAEDGLSFSRYNYGAGLVLSMPLLQFTRVRHQVHAQESLIKAEEEKLNLTRLHLEKQNQVADVTLRHALQIASESPVYYESAAYSYRALQSRYNSGLVNYADLIQAQYMLVKSEADLKKSYMEAWKALLYKAAVQGDINLFLDKIN